MSTAFDRVTIAVPDLAQAAAQYGALLGCNGPIERAEAADGPVLVDLGNTVIALEARSVHAPYIESLVLMSDAHSGPEQPVANSLGLEIGVCSSADSAARRERAVSALPGLSVDHVVLRSPDAQGCIDLFSLGLGVRLALDKTVEAWGGRMLFFRAGKMTLEVIANDSLDASDFWGIAYRCDAIDATCDRLSTAGVTVSAVRDGRKPGTRVATVKSHCLGIPTLLIEQVPGA